MVNKHFIICVIFFFIFVGCNKPQMGEGPCECWNYPLKPGMEEWNRLKTEEERIAVLQVPKGILAKLTPEDAICLIFTFPAFGNFTAFKSKNDDGFSVIASRYNILEHLVSRTDVGNSMIATYKDAGLKGFKTFPYSNEFWPLKFHFLELLLAQKGILQSLTAKEKLELLIETRKKLTERMLDEGFVSFDSACYTVRIMASILDMEKYAELIVSTNREKITRFIQTGFLELEDVFLLYELIDMTDNYIKIQE